MEIMPEDMVQPIKESEATRPAEPARAQESLEPISILPQPLSAQADTPMQFPEMLTGRIINELV